MPRERTYQTSNWVAGTTYKVGEIVRLAETSYTCLIAHTSDQTNKPGNTTYWSFA